jgi:anaerobic ribonucleoside-triphosphate reductase
MTKVKMTGQFARVVGYYRSVDAWNEGKKQEWKDRKLTVFG